MGQKIRCEKCGKSLDEVNYYTFRDKTKDTICKQDLTMHVDPFEPETFTWIMKRYDVPYLPEVWNSLRDRAYAKDPTKVSGTAITGKYLASMRMNQHKNERWMDTERLERERVDNLTKIEEDAAETAEKLREEYEAGKISEAEYRTLTDVSEQKKYDDLLFAQPNSPVPIANMPGQFNNPFQAQNFLDESEIPSLGDSLTKEDKIAMAIKWGRLYKADEWVQLETDYQKMKKSFDINDADTENVLIQLCKTNLKANQALDIGDTVTYQQLARVQDALRKSAKFTAVQNKEKKSDFIDSIGEMVAFCEKNKGAIPRWEIKAPADIIDKIIQDQKEYIKALVYEDTSLAQEIEDYLKQKKIQDDRKRDKEEARKMGLDAVPLSDIDYVHYLKELNDQHRMDEQILLDEETL